MQGLTLVLTGERHREHFRAFVDGEPTMFQNMAMIALLDLLTARLRTDAGFGNAKKGAVHRLRRRLGAHGKALIETGNKGEYRIALTRDEMRKQVGLTPCFAELTKFGVVSEPDLAELQKHCKACKLPKKPPANRKRTKRKPRGNRQ
jgi:hypothetical protein